jgi:hypothetical protein
MASTFKNSVTSNIGTTPTTVVSIADGFRATVIGFNVANKTDYDTVTFSAWIVDEVAAEAYYIKDITIPPNTSLKLVTNGEKIILPPLYSLKVVSSQADSIDTIVSYVELS